MIYYIYCTLKLFIGPSSQHYYTAIVFFLRIVLRF